MENFRRAWLRFELFAKAKKWGEEEQVSIIATLLRDKLLDVYHELPDEAKKHLISESTRFSDEVLMDRLGQNYKEKIK